MAGILNAIKISSQGLSVQRNKMNVVAKNIANAETTKTEDGGPYRRERVIVSENSENGRFNSHLKNANVKLARTSSGHISGRSQIENTEVKLSNVDMETVQDPASNFKLVYDPSHPDADEEGYVKYPDIEIINEMVDMMAASRAYEANTVAISSAKTMAKNAIDI